MKITDEPEYFEAAVSTEPIYRVEVSAYRGSGRVLLDGQNLTPRHARQLGRYLIKASQLAKTAQTTTKRSTR